MAKGKKTGGRKRGSQNKKTAALQRAVEQAVGELIEPFEGDSYAFLATLYKNKELPLAVRLDAAKTAIAYERPRLSNVAMTTKSLDDMMTAEEIFEFRDQLKAFIAEAERQKAEQMLKAIEPIARRMETRLPLEHSLADFFRAAWPHASE
jgi:hypothetical protein